MLSQFVRLSFDVLGRVVEASFVQMADGLMQQFQASMSVFGASTMLVPAMVVMAFVLECFGVLKQFPQFSFDSFSTLGLSGLTQLGNVMPMPLNLDLQSKTLHASLDLVFDFFRFLCVPSLPKFGSFAAHRFDVAFKLFAFCVGLAIAVAFPFFLLSLLGTFPIFAPFTVAVSLFSFLGGYGLVTFPLPFVLSADGQQSSTDTAGNSCCQKHSTKRHGLSPD